MERRGSGKKRSQGYDPKIEQAFCISERARREFLVSERKIIGGKGEKIRLRVRTEKKFEKELAGRRHKKKEAGSKVLGGKGGKLKEV